MYPRKSARMLCSRPPSPTKTIPLPVTAARLVRRSRLWLAHSAMGAATGLLHLPCNIHIVLRYLKRPHLPVKVSKLSTLGVCIEFLHRNRPVCLPIEPRGVVGFRGILDV